MKALTDPFHRAQRRCTNEKLNRESERERERKRRDSANRSIFA